MTTNKETVLIVDDEPTDVDMLRKAVEEAGFNVLTAGDGYSAIRVFRDFGSEIRLLVVDVAMSPMSRHVTDEWLRSGAAACGLPA